MASIQITVTTTREEINMKTTVRALALAGATLLAVIASQVHARSLVYLVNKTGIHFEEVKYVSSSGLSARSVTGLELEYAFQAFPKDRGELSHVFLTDSAGTFRLMVSYQENGETRYAKASLDMVPDNESMILSLERVIGGDRDALQSVTKEEFDRAG